MVCSRVSNSLVTVAFTKLSGTCWRSTRTVAVARYRSGRERMRLTPAVRGNMKTKAASHLRRRHTARSRSNSIGLLSPSATSDIPLGTLGAWVLLARLRPVEPGVLDLVEQGSVADPQELRRLEAIPSSLLERGQDGVRFS